MIWLALLILGLSFWLARAAYKLGKVHAHRETASLIVEATDNAFRAGFRAHEAAEDFGTSDHIKAQRRNAGIQ